MSIKCPKCSSENLTEGDSFHWDIWIIFSNYVISTEFFCDKCWYHFKYRSS